MKSLSIVNELMQRSYYKDKWIRIICSLLFSYIIDAMGRPESLFQRMTSANFYIDLISGFLMTIAVWQIIRAGIVYLDSKYDWLENTFERILWQGLTCVVAPLLLSFLLTFAYMHFAWNQDIFKTEWLYNEVFTILVFIVFINFLYFTLWLMHQRKAINPGNTQTELFSSPPTGAAKPTNIEVTKGEKIIMLPTATITYAYLKDGYCYIRTSEESYVTTYALDDLIQWLSNDDFFRANRQTIINRSSCKAYSSIENGKIRVELEPDHKHECIVSQKRAKAFRDWISNHKR